jgi:hypothetical protein
MQMEGKFVSSKIEDNFCKVSVNKIYKGYFIYDLLLGGQIFSVLYFTYWLTEWCHQQTKNRVEQSILVNHW